MWHYDFMELSEFWKSFHSLSHLLLLLVFFFFLLNEPSIAKVSKHLNFHGLVRGKKKKNWWTIALFSNLAYNMKYSILDYTTKIQDVTYKIHWVPALLLFVWKLHDVTDIGRFICEIRFWKTIFSIFIHYFIVLYTSISAPFLTL